MQKTRLDSYLASEGLSKSREKAKKEIISGWVRVNGETVRDPAKVVTGDEDVTVKRPGGTYVSRGGEKLEKALREFDIDLKGKNAVDLGASTGGFTDCLLKNGANTVYSIDVGYGQLDYSLRVNEKVHVMERTNVRNLTGAEFKHGIDFITADLSFISITRVIEKIKEIFAPVEGIILLKPQFEADKGEHKKGVVRKKDLHIIILKRVLAALVEMGVSVKGLSYSPIKGPKGNIEFLLYFGLGEKSVIDSNALDKLVSKTVDSAHLELNS